MLPFLPNALRTNEENAVYSLQFLPGNLLPKRNKRYSASILITTIIFSDALLVSPKLQISDILSRYLVYLLQIESLHIKAFVATLHNNRLSPTFVTTK